MTYEMMKEQYLHGLRARGKSEHTVTAYRLALDKFEPFAVGGITLEQICRFRDTLEVSRNTARDYMLRLSCFLTYAARMGYIEANPLDTSEIPKKQAKEYNIPTYDEIQKLISAPAPNNGKKACRNKTLVVLLLTSGLRSEEIRTLKVSDLDFEGGTVLVRRGKGGKFRHAPFPRLAQDVVQKYITAEQISDNDILFGNCTDSGGHGNTSERHPMASVTLNGIIQRYVKKVIGKDVTCHTLRHCAASVWADMGVSIRDVQQALGHKSVQTTEQIYVQVLHREKSAQKICEAYNS